VSEEQSTPHAQQPGHLPVMPDEVLALLDPKPGQSALDCTVGRGGHAELIIPRLGAGGRYLALDLDPANVAFAHARLAPIAQRAGVQLHVVHANFAHARALLAQHHLPHVDLLLADLGFASSQMDDPARGFSFQEGPLDMRLDPTSPTTAADLVNTLPEKQLADLIYQFGEERLSRRIARKIVERRHESPMESTSELAELVRRAYGPQGRRSRIHPATRTFMALRIAVNGELDALDTLLADLPSLLAPGARAAILSFHSLEDRRVKQAFLRMQQEGWAQRLTRKAGKASDAEIAANPRSRSARLRALRRMDEHDTAQPAHKNL
jgi:16S rRNA (cytosine1402-N4)-methyltransferase